MISKPTYDELYNRMWNRVSQATGLTNNTESGIASNILKVFVQEMLGLWDELEAVDSSGNLSTAYGSYLDNIGNFFGVARLTASAASTLGNASSVRFTNNSMSAVTVPNGTRVWPSSNPRLAYSTVFSVTVQPGAYALVDIIANGLGTDYNVGSGVIDSSSLGLQTVTVTNDLPITTGTDLESDENYRARIKEELYRREGPNTQALHAALLQVPGVRDVLIMNLYRGTGTVDILIYGYDREVPQSVINDCQTVLDLTVAAGVSAIAKAPKSIYVDVEIKLKLKATTSLNVNNLVSASVRGYIDNLPIEDGTGNSLLVYNELLARIQQSSTDIIDSNIVLTVDNLPALRTNQSLNIGERFISRAINIS